MFVELLWRVGERLRQASTEGARFMVKHPDIRPGFAPPMVFRVDGMRRDPGEAAVLEPQRRDAFVGLLPWSLEVPRSLVLPAPIVELASGPLVHRRGTETWLGVLRPLLLHARGCPRFVLCTITRIEVTPIRVRLFGTCAPLMFDAPGPGYRGDRTRRQADTHALSTAVVCPHYDPPQNWLLHLSGAMSKVFIAFDRLQEQHRARYRAPLRSRLQVNAAFCGRQAPNYLGLNECATLKVDGKIRDPAQ